LTALLPRKSARGQRKLLIAAAAIILLGYIAGRAAFERAGGVLVNNGLGPGVASIAPAPLYLGVVVTTVWVATRLCSPLGGIWVTLRISSQVLRYIAVGVLGSALLVASTYGVEFVRGWITVRRVEPSTRLITDLGVYALLYSIIAFNEELVFRGGLLESLTRLGGSLWGVVGSSMLFTMVHLADNPPSQRLLGLFLFGLLLAELYLIVRSLWLPVAVHWAVSVLSFAAVIGLPPIQIHLNGPMWMIGLPDQPDAGWVMIAALAVANVGLTWHLMTSDAGMTAMKSPPKL
jgi:membrane protease YdiL (CAAX protease family)